jgi:hypothetical protein
MAGSMSVIGIFQQLLLLRRRTRLLVLPELEPCSTHYEMYDR